MTERNPADAQYCRCGKLWIDCRWDLGDPELCRLWQDNPDMTEHEIQQRVDRMLAHLDRLLLNKDMSEDDYHQALNDLSRWEEKAMTELEAERRSITDDVISNNKTQNPKP